MKEADFVHLHLHTEYSLLDGACRIDRLFARAKELGQTAAAITDHGVMYGALAFYKAAKKAGVKPIIGCEVYVAPGDRRRKEALADRGYDHLILLCKNRVGYQNLIRMVTLSYTEGFYQKPRIDLSLLREHHEGLIALSGCLMGRLPRLLLQGEMTAAREHIREMKEIFGEDYFVELQNHGLPDERRAAVLLSSLAEQFGVPLVATNDVHYPERADARSHDVLLCIQTRAVLSDPDRMHFANDEFYLKSGEEMAALFPDHPEAIANTRVIADRCELEFDLTSAHLPKYRNPENVSSAEYLKKLCLEGLERRFGEYRIADRAPYRERLAYELSVVEKMGFCDYFLIVADFVRYAKSRGIYVGPGRGSGAGSLAAFCLDITELDPIAYGLIFERFLNPERVSMPDFDIDFCFERRHEVIDYLVEKYGAEQVAQIVTFNTMAARAVVRDVGRVLGMSYAETDRIAKRIPPFLDMTLERALKSDAELRALCASGPAKELMEVALTLEGMPRNASIHAAGVVLTDEPVDEYVPLAVNNGAKVTQFTMKEIADLGLLKIDLLGLRYLTVIRDAEALIRKKDRDFDVRRVPLDDEETFRMIADGETAGMFQIESSGMRAVMMQMRPENIEDVIAAIALFRPGPKKFIPRYVENKKSGKIDYTVPQLEPILRSTYGCVVYQEQVMQIFRELAGYSFGRADVVRRAMSKKQKDVMEKEREVFLHGAKDENGAVLVEGCAARGIPAEKAAAVFDEMADFAEYAFNRSHAAAYGILSYRTAFLKCKFPREYMAAVLTNQMGGDKNAYYYSECRRMGLTVLPPSIVSGEWAFTVENGAVRFGFCGVKNLGRGIAEAIVSERRTRPFSSYLDFVVRLKRFGLNRKALESLIASGALDPFGISRARLFAAVEIALERAGQTDRGAMAGQMSLFDLGGPQPGAGEVEFPAVADFPQKQKLALEKEACGVYLSGHPLYDHRESEAFTDADFASVSDRESFPEGRWVTLFCMIGHVTLKPLKSGEKMAFLQAEDLTGSGEIIVFPKTLEKYRSLLNADEMLYVRGQINSRDEETKIVAAAFFPAGSPPSPSPRESARRSAAAAPQKNEKNIKVSKIYLRFPRKTDIMIGKVIDLLSARPGKTPVYFYFEDEKKLVSPGGILVSPGEELLAKLKDLLGKDNVALKA